MSISLDLVSGLVSEPGIGFLGERVAKPIAVLVTE
jgi:hypothetical protein